MKAWLFITNVGVVLVGVGMCGARLAGETKVKEIDGKKGIKE